MTENGNFCIVLQCVGTNSVREHSWVWGWGIRYPCDWRARSLGSKRPSGIYSRRDVLLDHISGYIGKTLVFEK